jgi:hypothetical protein|tara:strand:+ start:5080 stop:5457 length:378 start_codon:yes stop_codon:yes gene_type:complete
MILYHATWPSRTFPICEEGLSPGSYLAGPTVAHAVQFLALRSEIDGVREVEIDGEKHWVPNVVENDSIFVFEVDTAELDTDLLHESSDHAAGFWHEDTKSYWYEGAIGLEAIELAYRIDMADILV